jgi:hypothetical protein
MDLRAERMAANEVAHRRLNEKIEGSYESHPLDSRMDVVCECGQEVCDVFLTVAKPELEDVRASGRQFIIFRDHLNPEVDVLVFEHERFTVVAKREGEPAEFAEQTDPRHEPGS